ncbi:MAG: murein biosynthesis integral membrane protein MurJ [Candidatus Omnitrophota bacterium]|nr:murein biosynthesis integral membrane protein MurJ [Candidatus Omnitrophota bacterium]MBU2034414.1 murein biosynthesis integral membrane protein MurJ [Candidatus Omnitrophota bacterium]MBU2221635.1 murein biosynthesis integral membrane protein MurJ [Candidatus Omnitrophota bacterium]MBU2258766.1 murein biosynthesis integral membrane protein MurJ [Candidatus Omnitrophota bacterium]
MSINKSKNPHSHRGIARSAGIISLATFCSRILGFARDIVIARLFGVYVYAQAFVIAFKIPNLLRDFVGEGATNAVFVPVFTEYKVKHSPKEFWELANVVLVILSAVLFIITLSGIIFSPLIVRLIAPGFIASADKLEATIRLNQIIFPYIILISLAAFTMGLLNTLGHFSVPAFAPCLLNISIIVFALIWGEGIKGLAAGVLIGGFLQLAIQVPVLYRKGFRLKFPRNFRHPAAKTIFRLMLPRAASSSIYQLNNFVDSIFGSLAFIVGEGGVAVLYFAYRLILFPVGIFSSALSQAILPAFSHQAAENDHIGLRRTLSFGLRANFFVMLPATVGFMVLSRVIVSGLFEGGKFDSHSVEITSRVLLFYSIGLFAYGGVKLFNSCLFALKDTFTPAKISFLSLSLSVTFNSILVFPMKLSGLALANSISGIITFIVLAVILKKKLGGLELKSMRGSFLKICLASFGMGLVCFLALGWNISSGYHIIDRILKVAVPITAGLISYAAFCFILKVEQIGELLRWLKNRQTMGTPR